MLSVCAVRSIRAGLYSLTVVLCRRNDLILGTNTAKTGSNVMSPDDNKSHVPTMVQISRVRHCLHSANKYSQRLL